MEHGYEFDLLCIGAGPAGRAAAVAAAKLGKRVALIEKRRSLADLGAQGGTFPSKTLREAVRAFKQRKRSAAIASSFEVPRFDFARAKERIEEVCEQEAIQFTEALARNRVEFVNGKARFVDRHTLAIESLYGVREVTSQFILIATGTHARELPDTPCDGELFLDESQLFEQPELPNSILVLGAGVLGLELGSMLAAVGVEVTWVDDRATPLPFLDAEVRMELLRQLGGGGVRCEFGCAATRVVGETTEFGQAVVVELANGRSLRADAALVAIDREGTTGSLGLGNLGLETDARGMIGVDVNHRTTCENVFAVGDVIGRSWHQGDAREQGREAALSMFGVASDSGSSAQVAGFYSVPEVAFVGATEQELVTRGVDYVSGVARYREVARGAMVGDDQGFLKLLFERSTRRLLGTHGVGVNATELVHVAQAVMTLGGTLAYFLDNVFNYPTFAECYKLAAHDAASKFDFRDPVPA